MHWIEGERRKNIIDVRLFNRISDDTRVRRTCIRKKSSLYFRDLTHLYNFDTVCARDCELKCKRHEIAKLLLLLCPCPHGLVVDNLNKLRP